jgi:hypothetical protein
MKSRKGYSEETLSNTSNLDNVFCLADQSLLICNVNKSLTWNSSQNKLTKENIRDYPAEINASNEIIKIANSNDLFLFIHTSRDPDHNDLENVTTTLFKGKDKSCEILIPLQFPVLIDNDNLLGITEDNKLFEYNFATGAVRQLYEFNNKIKGFYEVKNNHFVVVDETSALTLYQLDKTEFIKLNAVKDIKTIQTIQALNDDYFVCSIFDNQGNRNIKPKDCQTKLQFFKKDGLNCVQEIKIKGVRINLLKHLPDDNVLSHTFIGRDNKNICIINFKDNHVCKLDMGSYINDFSLSDSGKLSMVVGDITEACRLIEIEPDLLAQLYTESFQKVSQKIMEEKKDITDSTLTINSTSFFSTSNADTASKQKKQAIITSCVQLFNEDDGSSSHEVFSQLSLEILGRLKILIEKVIEKRNANTKNR